MAIYPIPTLILVLLFNVMALLIHTNKRIKEKIGTKKGIIDIIPIVAYCIFILIQTIVNVEILPHIGRFFFLNIFLYYFILFKSNFNGFFAPRKEILIPNEVVSAFWIYGLFFGICSIQTLIILGK